MKTKVALFVNGWNCENVDNFIDGFNSFFSKDTVDLFVFTSYSLTVNDEKMIEAEDSIYSLADISFFDAAIVFGSGINSEEVVLKIRRKCEKAGVPIIFQGIEAEGITTVTVDNYIGMKKLCEHLIEKHGVNDVTFIAGPKDNADSNLRIKAVRETLESYGYSLKDESIYYASWEPTLIRDYLIENYRDMRMKLPDAFVCANDYMALMVIHFLDELGYKIPDDVIVSGFDNVSDGKVCYPSLATVNQNYQEQGRECAKLILEVIADKKMIKKSIIPCVGMPGESCGCSECNDETQMRKEYARVWCAEQYYWDNFQGRESELDMCIMSTAIFENIQQSINEEFFSQICQETEDFHIYLNPQYKNLDYMDDTKVIYKEPSFGPIMDVICARTDGFAHCENTVNIKKLLLGYDGNATGKTYVFKSLKIGSTAIGYMAMGYKAGAFKRQEYLKFSNSLNKTFKKYQRNIDDNNKAIRIQEQAYEFLRQTVEALAAAVDAKDSYTNGHSKRVAKYARKIAEEVGMTEKECDNVYLAGLLHDVGKIGIDDSIINKKGKLTDEEFAVIKLHPGLGGQILSKIVISPSLSVGARYHHERYDGHGYPDNLKGTDIPQIARIISVADAYDAMTSNRSYRNQIPQQVVREEIIKGIGTQFDPIFAKIMVHLIDKDVEFQMQERIDFSDDTENTKLSCEEFRTNFAEAVRINEMKTKIHFKYENTAGENSMPAFVLFDSLDARVHKGDDYEKSLSYHEYGELRINGEHVFGGVRKTQIEFDEILNAPSNEGQIELVKDNDHLYFEMIACGQKMTATLCLPDNTRYVYVSITGENCEIYDIAYERATDAIQEGSIERIAEEITYLNGVEGDIPSIQVDGWRTAATEGIMLDGDMEITFDMNSLPFARLIWHCPFFVIFHSDDGKVYGENYIEYSVVRLNGESWSESEQCENYSICNITEEFPGWEQWKLDNIAGRKSKIYIHKSGNKIVLQTENGGIEIENTTIINDGSTDIYFAFSGDQCTVENIHYHRIEVL